MSSQPTETKRAEFMPASDLSAWQVETLRLTAFSTALPDLSSIKWWETVTGEPSETKTLQQRTGRLQETGRIKGGFCNLSLECQPQRIDWLFSPIVKDDQELKSFPTFVSLPDGLKIYEEMLLPWIAQCPTLNRVAFGAALTQPVENRRAGYQTLAKLLPAVELDPEGSSDFSYQINRPRVSKSGVQNLRINRLSRWGVVRLSGIMVQVTAGQPTARVFESSQEVNACRVELDINTSPQFQGTFPSETLASLVKELMDLGIEIASNGDIP